VVPILLNLSLTYRPIDEPTKVPALEFPRRTTISCLTRAFLLNPTWFIALVSLIHGEKEKHLPLDMYRDVPPSLLETLDSLQGCPQQLGHLTLGFSQMGTNPGEFISVHPKPPMVFIIIPQCVSKPEEPFFQVPAELVQYFLPHSP
jgi:hypothetical protein